MEEPKQDSGNLTPIEKYKELQKQDWQLEGLIVTSIIYGLFQIPELLQNNMSRFLNFLPSTEIVFAWFQILGLAAIVLISNLLLLIMYRLIWIIVAFSPNTDYDRLQRLNDLSGLHLSFGFRWFLFLVTSSFISMMFYGFLDIFLGLNGVLAQIMVISIYILFPVSMFEGIIFQFVDDSNTSAVKIRKWYAGFLGLLFCMVNPLVMLLFAFSGNIQRTIQKEMGFKYSLDLLNYAKVFSKITSISEMSRAISTLLNAVILLVVPPVIMYTFSKTELRKDTDLIQVAQNERYMLFKVDQTLVHANNSNVLMFGKKIPPHEKFNLSQLGVTVNGKKKAVNWLWNRGEADYGIHAYVNHQDLDSGVNIIRIKFGKYQEELEFYRAK